MAFSVDDMIEVLKGDHTTKIVRDRIHGECANIKYNDIDLLKSLFPGESFSDTESVAYAAAKMCHSFPKINARRRTFFPKVLANSCASARDNFVNIDHLVEDNGLTTENKILGHIKAADFQWKEVADIPTEPVPMHALLALYLRHPEAREIVSEHRQKKNWLTSMECGHDMEKAAFLYEDEIIPVADAPHAMRECVKAHTVLPYRGKDLSLCIGGTSGIVDFWGLALTESPADDEASIIGMTSFAREMSTRGGQRKKYFGIRFEKYFPKAKTAEAATAVVDTRINEIASISVIGKTEPAEDGHVHDVLSDGTIVPYAGHTHYMSCYQLVTGSKPRFTGRTDTHHVYACDPCSPSYSRQEPHVHMHMIDITLRGKRTAAESDDPVLEMSNFSENDLMNLQAIADSITRLEAKVSNGNQAPAGDDIRRELASIKEAVGKASLDDTIKASVANEIANQISSGKLMTKEKADEAVAAAKAAADKESELKIKELDIRSKRRELVSALSVDLSFTGYEPAGGKSVGDFIDSFSTDDAGTRAFDAEVRSMKLAKQLAEATEKAEKAQLASQQVKQDQLAADRVIAAEAANKGKSNSLFIVGKPTTTEKTSETASAGKPIGRDALFASR